MGDSGFNEIEMAVLEVTLFQFVDMEGLKMFLSFELLLPDQLSRICCSSRSHLALCR